MLFVIMVKRQKKKKFSRVCRSFFISGNWKFSLQIITLLKGWLGVLQLNIDTWNIRYWLNTNLFFFIYMMWCIIRYISKGREHLKVSQKKIYFFNGFVFFLHLWCYVCRSTIQLWGKMNTAHYMLVSWAFTLVKALVLQKRKLAGE